MLINDIQECEAKITEGKQQLDILLFKLSQIIGEERFREDLYKLKEEVEQGKEIVTWSELV